MATRKLKSPRKARTSAQIAAMPFDNVGGRGYWISVDETTVTLSREKHGESLDMPRWIFEAFVDWYNYGEIPRFETRKPALRENKA